VTEGMRRNIALFIVDLKIATAAKKYG